MSFVILTNHRNIRQRSNHEELKTLKQRASVNPSKSTCCLWLTSHILLTTMTLTPVEASELQAYLQQCVRSSILHFITLVRPVVPLCQIYEGARVGICWESGVNTKYVYSLTETKFAGCVYQSKNIFSFRDSFFAFSYGKQNFWHTWDK